MTAPPRVPLVLNVTPLELHCETCDDRCGHELIALDNDALLVMCGRCGATHQLEEA